MQDANMNILILAGALIGIIILIASIALFGSMNKGRKATKQKLTRFQERFGESKTLAGERARSIRVNQKETGLAGTLAKLLPNGDQIQARLAKGGMNPSLSRYATISGGIGILTLITVLILGGSAIFAFFMGIIGGVGLPHYFLNMRVNSRIAKFTKQFPEAMDLMVRGLKSGLPVNECIANVATELPAPTGTEFQRITDSMRLGKQLEEALWETADRLDTPDFKFFVISLVVQRETGGNLGETLENLANILRQRQAMKLKIKALSSEAKASAWIVGCLPFIMLGVIMLLNYDYGIVLFTHAKAQIAGIVALVWMSFGVFIMSRMISFEV